ncbi:MAG: translation elongation factor Ts [Bacteroidia bacterium]|jgi:elongation factor Ts
MSITASDVNKLRQMTGAGMMDCKKALEEAAGNFEEAVVILRKKGQKISASRADRTASEGVVIVSVTNDRTSGVIVELNCETDFVAKNDDFMAFANKIAALALENKPADLAALMALTMDGLAISELVIEYTGKIGEKIDLSRYMLVSGANLVGYIHSNNKLGVMVTMNNAPSDANEVAGKDVAMQIAAMSPIAVDENAVDPAIIAREMEIGREQAIADGKNEQMAENISRGKANKWLKENTLLPQPFVKDGSKSVKEYLNSVESDLTVVSFLRIAVGA